MIGKELTRHIALSLREIYHTTGFKLECLESWTAERGHRVSKSTVSRLLNQRTTRTQRKTAEQIALFLEMETSGRLRAKDLLAGNGLVAHQEAFAKAYSGPSATPHYPITTVAGTGIFAYNGDGIPAVEAHLDRPMSVSLNAQGDLVICDHMSHRVRQVSGKSGIISTLAGTGQKGPAQIGALATRTEFHDPTYAIIDDRGDLYICCISHCVYKVNGETGLVSMACGTEEPGYGGDGGPAASALFYQPRQVQWDASGHMYVLDRLNNCLRAVDADTGTVRTVFDKGFVRSASGMVEPYALKGPGGFCPAPDGGYYIADMYGDRVCKADGESGEVIAIAGVGRKGFAGDGGPAGNAQFDQPHDVAVDGAGHLFIVDRFNHRIRRIDVDSGIITTVAGTGTPGYNADEIDATQAHLSSPTSICLSEQGDLYIADAFNSRVRKVTGVGVPF